MTIETSEPERLKVSKEQTLQGSGYTPSGSRSTVRTDIVIPTINKARPDATEAEARHNAVPRNRPSEVHVAGPEVLVASQSEDVEPLFGGHPQFVGSEPRAAIAGSDAFPLRSELDLGDVDAGWRYYAFVVDALGVDVAVDAANLGKPLARESGVEQGDAQEAGFGLLGVPVERLDGVLEGVVVLGFASPEGVIDLDGQIALELDSEYLEKVPRGARDELQSGGSKNDIGRGHTWIILSESVVEALLSLAEYLKHIYKTKICN